MQTQSVNSGLPQPSRTDPFIPPAWVHRYHKVRLTRRKDGVATEIPCTAANFFLMDLNPRWYVDQLIRTQGSSLFILYLDTANACTDRCPMCFTAATRHEEGLHQRLDVDLALRRITQLRERYPETFRMVSMAGPGEPLALKRIDELVAGAADLGVAVRVYTAGKRLREAKVRQVLAERTTLVRVSVDATEEETYRATHGVGGLAERRDSIAAFVEDRNRSGSRTLIGMHFVIQKANAAEIVPFARMGRDLGCDFVVYGQETFGKVAGGFSEDEGRKVVEDLQEVELMHNDSFAVVVPKLVHRQTYVKFDKEYYASPETLNRCHNSKHRIFFGVQNDFSACWLATLDQTFRKESYVGKLDSDETMKTMFEVIEHGVGDGLGRGAHLSCNSCVADNYNSMVDRIFEHLGDDPDFDSEIVHHVPGRPEDPDYTFLLGGKRPGEVIGPVAPRMPKRELKLIGAP